MRTFHWIGLGLGLAMAAGRSETIAPGLPTLAQSSPSPTPALAVKGNCGTDLTCDQLLQTLRTQWPTAKLNCTRDRILSLHVFKNSQGGRQVQVACWNTELKKGDRYGLSRYNLPYPGDEAQFLPPLPRRSRYTEALTTRYADQVRTSQNECGFLGGDIQFRTRKELDLLELQCVFTVSAILIDTDGDFVSDGEAAKGTFTDKIVGKFTLSEIEKPLVAQPQAARPSAETPVNVTPLPPLNQEDSVTEVFPNAVPADSAAPGQPAASPTATGPGSTNAVLEAIDVQIFNRLKNQLVPLSQRWNPYGLGMDLLIAVRVKPGAQAVQPGTNLVLSINAKGYNTPATGPVPAWNSVQTRSLSFISNDQFSHSFPFLADYRCYPQVQLTATLIQPGQSPGPSLTKTLDLSCAE